MVKIHRQDGSLTAYGLACGYMETYQYYPSDKRYDENNSACLYMVHAHYHLRGCINGVRVWEVYDTYSEAVSAYKTLVRYVKAMKADMTNYGEKRDYRKICVSNGKQRFVTTWAKNLDVALKVQLLGYTDACKVLNKPFTNLKFKVCYVKV